MIPKELLSQYQGKKVRYSKGDYVFKIHTKPHFYFQIDSGELKIYNVNSEGKEFIQSIFSTNRILGEAAILGEFMTYPTNCIALTEAILWQLSKKNFLMLLNNHPKIHFLISKNLANRFYYKSMIAKEVSFENPEHRIITLLLYLKHFIYNSQEPFEYCVELSRQDIANLTGLRVETVIRSVKKLEANNRLIIRNHKIHL